LVFGYRQSLEAKTLGKDRARVESVVAILRGLGLPE
jgi:hypothetical protein